MIVEGVRALAHIEKIEWVRPIEGADNIELIGVLGWVCIAKKGEFQVGDKAVYIEIDSRVPKEEPFMFLANKDFKVKTMKLGKFKVISQGLALPISLFDKLGTLEIGTDVTKQLGIMKIADSSDEVAFDPMTAIKQRNSKLMKRPWVKYMMRFKWFRKLIVMVLGRKRDKPKGWPTEISKTDEERIENMPWLLESEEVWLETEKIDGTSTTFLLRKKGRKKLEFIVCSRNLRQHSPDQKSFHDHNIYWSNALKYNIEEVMKDLLHELNLNWIAIQGESIGGSIQGNYYKIQDEMFLAFNVITSEVGRLSSYVAESLLKKYGVPFVPIIREVKLPSTMEEMKAMASGPSALNPKVMREGAVYRSIDGSKSFKNISREYLLKNDRERKE